jgi:hypothetical protein
MSNLFWIIDAPESNISFRSAPVRRRGRESSGNLGEDRPGGRKALLGWSAAVHFDRVWLQAQKDALRLDEVHQV